MTAISSRRKHTILAAIVADPYRKLAAIALALGLWYFLNDQITRDGKAKLILNDGVAGSVSPGVNMLQVRLGDDKVVGTGFSANNVNVANVEIKFRGQSADVDIVKDIVRRGQMQLVVDFSSITDWENTQYVEFEAEDIQLPGHMPSLDLEMDPPRVRLGVDIQESLPIAISLEDHVMLTIDDELDSRLRRATAKFLPDKAIVTGPAGGIRKLEQLIGDGQKPFKATISGNQNERDVRAVLKLNVPNAMGLSLNDPVMTILIDPRTEKFDLELPLWVDDLALQSALRGQYRPVPDIEFKRVSVNAGGELLSQLTIKKDEGQEALEEWAKNHLRLVVWIQPFDPSFTPELDLTREASLLVLGPLQSRVDSADHSLAHEVPITLRRRQ